MADYSPIPPSDETSVVKLRSAVLAGLAHEPAWDACDVVGPLCLSEAIEHPEQSPLLCLSQISDDGVILGELWLRPADIAPLIADLQTQLVTNYAAGTRRWLGQEDGPVLNMGLT